MSQLSIYIIISITFYTLALGRETGVYQWVCGQGCSDRWVARVAGGGLLPLVGDSFLCNCLVDAPE